MILSLFLASLTWQQIMINELYGAKLYQDCRLDVFLEQRDLSRQSIFE